MKFSVGLALVLLAIGAIMLIAGSRGTYKGFLSALASPGNNGSEPRRTS